MYSTRQKHLRKAYSDVNNYFCTINASFYGLNGYPDATLS